MTISSKTHIRNHLFIIWYYYYSHSIIVPGNDHVSDMDVATKKKVTTKKHAGPKTTATAKVVPKKSATAKPVSKVGPSKVKKVDFDSESDLGTYFVMELSLLYYFF